MPCWQVIYHLMTIRNEDGSDIIKLYHYICKTPLTFPEYVSLARDLLRKIIVSDPKEN